MNLFALFDNQEGSFSYHEVQASHCFDCHPAKIINETLYS